MGKQSSKGTLPVSVVLDTSLLSDVDARVAALDMNRSQYFRRRARRDLAEAKASKPTLRKAA